MKTTFFCYLCPQSNIMYLYYCCPSSSAILYTLLLTDIEQAFKTLRADSCTSDIVVALISLKKVKNLIFQSKYDNTFWFLQLGWASAQPGLSKCQLFSIATERNITNFCRVTTCSFMYKKSPWLDFLRNFCLTCNPQEWQQYLTYMN